MILQGANDPRVLQIESDEMVKAVSMVYMWNTYFLKMQVTDLRKNSSRLKDIVKFLRGK